MRRKGLALAAVLLLGVLSACGRPAPTAQAPVPPAVEAAVEIIPRATLFADPDKSKPLISPDGGKIAYLAPHNGYLNVFVMDRPQEGATPAPPRPVTSDAQRGVHEFMWSADGRFVIFLQDKAGDENWRVFAVEAATGVLRDLTPMEGISAQIVGVSPSKPAEVVVAINERDPRWHDLFTVNITDGEMKLLDRNTHGFSEYVLDRDNEVRLARKNLPNGAAEIHRREGNYFAKMMEIPFEDSASTRVIGFSKDGKTFLMLDSIGRDKTALVEVDAATGAKKVLGANDKADVSEVLIDPEAYSPEAFGHEYLVMERTSLSPEAQNDLNFLAANLSKRHTVVSRSRDDRYWIVVEEHPTQPGRAYIYNRTDPASLTRLFDLRPALAGVALASMTPVEIPSRDGQTLVSYLTLPNGSDADGNSRPEKPRPLVLVAHRGPWARDSFGFRPAHQWLANRGYAVLSVNFRGSTGFGKAFVNAGNREWGGKILDDLEDAADWAIKEGVTKADQVAIMGGSFGGYAVVASLARAPERYACGVALAAPTNLETYLASVPRYWESRRNELALRVGDPETPEGRALLALHSPIHNAGRIHRPLLIAQGANDPRVKPSEAEALAAAMAESGAPLTYLIYPDEGASLVRPQNRISFYAAAEAFLSQCLTGPAQPFGEDLQGSSLEVKAGAEGVPGLADAAAAALEQAGQSAHKAGLISQPSE